MEKELIYEAISNVMAEIGAVGKNSRNSSQGFMYRGIDAVMNAINPALVKYKVFVAPEVLEQNREERINSKGTVLIYSICKIKFRFYTTDGSHVEVVTIGEGMDSGDKATNKAMSIAFKYACFQLFCIPTEEMVDPDSECHEVAPKSNKPQDNGVEPPKESNKGKKASEKQIAFIKQTVKEIDKMLAFYGVEKIEDLTMAQASAVIAAKGGNK
jgi:hypothetical protein